MQAVLPGRRRQRVQVLIFIGLWALIAGVFAGITWLLSDPSAVRGATGAPDWLYWADFLCLAVLALASRAAWRLSPKRRAWIIWRANPEYRGRHHEEIDERGLTWTAPTGAQVFIPWNVVAGVRETDGAFHLMDAEGSVRSSLPKRGLASPDLVPVLRDLLSASAGSRPSAATAV